jgi:hypothetical protein
MGRIDLHPHPGRRSTTWLLPVLRLDHCALHGQHEARCDDRAHHDDHERGPPPHGPVTVHATDDRADATLGGPATTTVAPMPNTMIQNRPLAVSAHPIGSTIDS